MQVKPRRLRVGLLAVWMLFGCPHNQRVQLEVGASATEARHGRASLAVPRSWRPLEGSSARAEFIAPDNRSRSYLRAMPAETDERGCRRLAQEYADEYIASWGEGSRSRVAHRTARESVVDFELRREESTPRAEVVWARVLCKDGVLAVASCTVSVAREAALVKTCRTVLESLQIAKAKR